MDGNFRKKSETLENKEKILWMERSEKIQMDGKRPKGPSAPIFVLFVITFTSK